MSLTDLHLCKNSVTSKSGNESDGCECPPEYYCADFCGEDFSLSTVISWQHFPRSTSSRSRCDDTSEEEKKSLTDTTIPIDKSEERESEKLSTTEYPITKSFAQLNAIHYLKVRHVFELLNFMIGHLVCNEPEEPVEFLENLLGQCLKFRDSFGEPPLLFTQSHIKSLYNAFDPFERGYVTVDQYTEALDTLGLKNGITQYNEEPPLNDEGYVEDKYLMFEAEKCLVENLRQILRIPKLAEENRLKWIKKVEKHKEKNAAQKLKSVEEGLSKDIDDNKFCECFCGKPNLSLICRCPQESSLQVEPEQLYLNK